MTEARRSHLPTLPVLLLLVGVMLAVVGVQLYVSERDDQQRQDAARAREVADRAYADCLTEFASDLVDTLQVARQASKKIERAQAAKDDALDRLLAVTEAARKVPPEATDLDFDRALQARVDAQDRFDRVKDQVADLREENPYVAPEARCTR